MGGKVVIFDQSGDCKLEPNAPCRTQMDHSVKDRKSFEAWHEQSVLTPGCKVGCREEVREAAHSPWVDAHTGMEAVSSAAGQTVAMEGEMCLGLTVWMTGEETRRAGGVQVLPQRQEVVRWCSGMPRCWCGRVRPRAVVGILEHARLASCCCLCRLTH